MNKNKFWIILFLFACFKGVYAQTTNRFLATSSASEVLSPIDGRSGAMGETGVSTAVDVAAPFQNMAKLPFHVKKMGLGVHFSPWLLNFGGGYRAGLSFFGSPTDRISFGVTLQDFLSGKVDYTDDNGNSLGFTAMPNTLMASAGVAFLVIPNLSVGLTLKYINSILTAGGPASVPGYTYNFKPGHAFATDVSLFYSSLTKDEILSGVGDDTYQHFMVGLVLANLGTKISYGSGNSYFLPAQIGLGGTFSKLITSNFIFTATLEAYKSLVPVATLGTEQAVFRQSVFNSWLNSFSGNSIQDWRFAVGVEAAVMGFLAIRLGYTYNLLGINGLAKGNTNYITTGLGLKFNNYGLNVSYALPNFFGKNVLPQALGNTIRISFIVDFIGIWDTQ